jgi:hypothetical protein
MVQAGDHLRFALEALEARGAGGAVGGKELERGVAVERCVAGVPTLGARWTRPAVQLAATRLDGDGWLRWIR